MGSSSNIGNISKYQFKQNANYIRSKMVSSAGETSYKYSSNEYIYGGNNYEGFSQYQYLDDSEFEVIDFSVHLIINF